MSSSNTSSSPLAPMLFLLLCGSTAAMVLNFSDTPDQQSLDQQSQEQLSAARAAFGNNGKPQQSRAALVQRRVNANQNWDGLSGRDAAYIERLNLSGKNVFQPENMQEAQTACRTRLNQIQIQMENCQFVEIGSKSAGRTSDLVSVVDRQLRQVMGSRGSRSNKQALFSEMLVLLNRAEGLLADAEQFPVINGSQKGRFPQVGTLVQFCHSPRARPRSGDRWSDSLRSIGRLYSDIIVHTERGTDYYFRLIQNGKTVCSEYCRGGDTLRWSVPNGNYGIRYAFASDSSWYGERYLFGPSTLFNSMGDQRNLENVEWTITLTKVANGNFTPDSLRPEDF